MIPQILFSLRQFSLVAVLGLTLAAGALAEDYPIGVPTENPFEADTAPGVLYHGLTEDFFRSSASRTRFQEKDPQGVLRSSFVADLPGALTPYQPLDPSHEANRKLLGSLTDHRNSNRFRPYYDLRPRTSDDGPAGTVARAIGEMHHDGSRRVYNDLRDVHDTYRGRPDGLYRGTEYSRPELYNLAGQRLQALSNIHQAAPDARYAEPSKVERYQTWYDQEGIRIADELEAARIAAAREAEAARLAAEEAARVQRTGGPTWTLPNPLYYGDKWIGGMFRRSQQAVGESPTEQPEQGIDLQQDQVGEDSSVSILGQG